MVCLPHLLMVRIYAGPRAHVNRPSVGEDPSRLSDLEPLLDRLVALLGPLETGPEPLEGGNTNRNYRARLGGQEYVIRLPGRDTDLLGIDRDAESEAAAVAARLGLAPEVAARLHDPSCLVTAFAPGRTPDEEDLADPALLDRLARALATLHDSGEQVEARFDPFQIVERYAQTIRDRGATVPADHARASAWAERIEEALSGAAGHEPVLCHNDLLAGNLLVDDERLQIVDWEYAGMGDRYFDLGNLAVNNGLDADAQERLLTAYLGESPGERRLAALGLMRYMSDFREAMWGAVQGVVSDLDVDFGEYARSHFERLRGAEPWLDGLLERVRGA
jgi:thiamine kinase-like enzyme